jgi:hypothetical protein
VGYELCVLHMECVLRARCEKREGGLTGLEVCEDEGRRLVGWFREPLLCETRHWRILGSGSIAVVPL